MRFKVSAVARAYGYAYVDADNLEAAEEKVRKLNELNFDWDPASDNLSIERVEQEAGDEPTAPEPQEANHESEPAPVEEPVEEEHGDEHEAEEDHPAKKGKKKHKR